MLHKCALKRITTKGGIKKEATNSERVEENDLLFFAIAGNLQKGQIKGKAVPPERISSQNCKRSKESTPTSRGKIPLKKRIPVTSWCASRNPPSHPFFWINAEYEVKNRGSVCMAVKTKWRKTTGCGTTSTFPHLFCTVSPHLHTEQPFLPQAHYIQTLLVKSNKKNSIL